MSRTATLRFTARDQARFAVLSGDRNDVHLDAVAARRLVAGEPIVHGMHLLLRMLEAAAPRRRRAGALVLDASFLRPALVAEPILVEADANGSLTAHAGGVTLVQATIGAADSAAARPDPSAARRASKVPARARSRTLEEIETAAGQLRLPAGTPLARAFPRVAREFGRDAAAVLAGISALVGMECPGRDSLLSAVRLRIASGARTHAIAWRVVRTDRRFGQVRIAISGAGVTGEVDAFLRPRPIAPPTVEDAVARVAPGEFSGQRALIVGGSRGLGAAAALLIAAGGGVPIVTYASGAADAAALRRAARAAGRAMETMRLDVTADRAPAVVARAVATHDVTHLYYFATPRIFVRRRPPFDAALFERFADVYVRAFAEVWTAAAAGRRLELFYPSTIAVDTPSADLTEYAAAKAAGECLCASLERSAAGSRVLVSRLPRVTTDQTTSIVPVASAAAIDVMLPIVREMQRRAAEPRR